MASELAKLTGTTKTASSSSPMHDLVRSRWRCADVWNANRSAKAWKLACTPCAAMLSGVRWSGRGLS